MNYKYNRNILNKEIEELKKIKGLEISNINDKLKILDIVLFNNKLKYQIFFNLDISNENNNFFKKDFQIVKSDFIDKTNLHKIITKYYNDFNFNKSPILSEFFKNLLDKINSSKEIKNDYDLNYLLKNFNLNNDNKNLIQKTLLIYFLSILFKILVGIYGYSGENDPPKFGDFEAQRHWMEITTNLNISNWYTNDKLTNPQNYWPIDYPPCSAYHSWFFGQIFKIIYPKSVGLLTSIGFESPVLKILMRLSALISDVIFFHISSNILIYYFHIKNNKKNYNKYYYHLFILLISPVLIIIDHGHFQYNQVMHGLFLFALYFLYNANIILAIIFYCLCVNFKQMGLYYSIPFPLYALKYIFKNNNILKSIIKICIYGIVTILTLVLIWLPWITTKTYEDVLRRIFPVKRGIFEDKVATFWCSINVFIKLNNYSQELLIKLCFLFTLLSCINPIICLIFSNKLNYKITNLAFFIISFGFYLFSFHVHEKTILIPYLAYLLCYFSLDFILSSFTLISMFSMFPLLKRENQIFTYAILQIMFFISSKFIQKIINMQKIHKNKIYKKNYLVLIFNVLEILIILFILAYHICEYFIPPPEKYPWLFPLINSFSSFCYFFAIFLIANIKILILSFSFKKNKIE